MSAPNKLPGWDALSAPEKNAVMRRYQDERFLATMSERGYVVLGAYEPGAIEWCVGSDAELERGRDSYGACAECGEPVVWAIRCGSSQEADQ